MFMCKFSLRSLHNSIWRMTQTRRQPAIRSFRSTTFTLLFLVSCDSSLRIINFIVMDVINDNLASLRRMQFRQIFEQIVAFGMIVSTALIIWKSLMLITGSESPIVVVLSGSMEPGFYRGDLLLLYQSSAPFEAGNIPVFNTGDGSAIPIVHRLLNIHSKRGNSDNGLVEQMLTKGDNNPSHDRPLYPQNLNWIVRRHIMGRALAYVPYVGMMTIWMNDYPVLKYILIAVLGLFVIINRE